MGSDGGKIHKKIKIKKIGEEEKKSKNDKKKKKWRRYVGGMSKGMMGRWRRNERKWREERAKKEKIK